MSCPTCGPYPSSPDDPVAVTTVAPCSPEAIAAKTAAAKILGAEWAKALPADKVVLLGRYGEQLARLMGNGYVVIENGVARAVSKVALKVDELWVTFERTTPRAAVAGNPPPFNYMVAVNEKGECFAMPGLATEDAISVWNFTTRKWEVRPTGSFPICVLGKLTGSGGLELVGFDPLDADDDDFENTQRCVKGLCAAQPGFLFAESKPAPGECFSCEQPVACGTTVTRVVPAPAFEVTTNPVKVYGWVFSSYTGPALREILNPNGGTPGADGAPGDRGERGLSGQPGPPGPPGAPGPAGPVGPIGETAYGGPAGPAGPVGPIGLQGNPGEKGSTGLTGATGPAGAAGAPGAAGAQGPGGSPGAAASFSESDLAKLSTTVQKLERHTGTTLITVVLASSGGSTYAVQAIGGVTMPHLTTGGNLVSIDAMLLEVVADSIDPQQDEAGVHNLVLTLNTVKAIEQAFTFAGTMGVVGVFPRLSEIHVSNELFVPWTGSTTNGNLVTVYTNTKFVTLPAGSVIPKYAADSGSYKVILKGFLVTRKVIPIYTP